MKRLLFDVYQWLVAIPILLPITALTAIATIILSPLVPNSELAYWPARMWARIICKLLFIKVEVRGLEHIQKGQSYVFVCNHQSLFDIFVIYGWLPVIFKWVMKAELRRIPLVGKACDSAGHIFINRDSPKAAQRSIVEAEQKLRNGVSVVLFPEGTRTYTGAVGKFKRGAFVLATDLSLPIIPMTLNGAFERLQRNSARVKPGKIELIVHEPVMVRGCTEDAQKELAKECREIIAAAARPL